MRDDHDKENETAAGIEKPVGRVSPPPRMLGENDDAYETRTGFATIRVNKPDPNWRRTAATAALSRQEGGDHYKDMPIQPAEFIHANAIGYFEGNVIKYVARWRKKNGIADLEKARHYIDLLIQLESKK